MWVSVRVLCILGFECVCSHVLYHTVVKYRKVIGVEHNSISCVLCRCKFLALKTLISDEELKFSDESLTSVEAFTFEPSDPPKRIEIVVLDDEVVEATETHLIRLRTPRREPLHTRMREGELLVLLSMWGPFYI